MRFRDAGVRRFLLDGVLVERDWVRAGAFGTTLHFRLARRLGPGMPREAYTHER